MFESLIGQELSKKLESINVTEPTDIQKAVIPAALLGRDVIGISKTGTGKTFAYLLPIVKKLDMESKHPQAVIIAPTHELAAQIKKQADFLLEDTGAKAALIIGGSSINRQLEALKEKPRLIVGAVGRILELIKLKKLTMHFVKTIVIDEADRMLDDKNCESLITLIKTTQKDRRLMFFSASFQGDSLKKAAALCRDVEVLNVTTCQKTVLPENILHMYFLCDKRDKLLTVRKAVSAMGVKKALLFTDDKTDIDNITNRLNYHGIKAMALYGGALKEKRRLALEAFRQGRITLLVVSDLASRGLDVDGVTHVFSLNVPLNNEIYLHRAGRCGRMGQEGTAVLIAADNELSDIKRLEKAFNIRIIHKDIRYGGIVNYNKKT